MLVSNCGKRSFNRGHCGGWQGQAMACSTVTCQCLDSRKSVCKALCILVEFGTVLWKKRRRSLLAGCVGGDMAVRSICIIALSYSVQLRWMICSEYGSVVQHAWNSMHTGGTRWSVSELEIMKSTDTGVQLLAYGFPAQCSTHERSCPAPERRSGFD